MIRAENLRKIFGAVTAVNDVSFHVHPGEIYGLIGPNGAGKTTTISMVCGLLRPDGGRVLVDGVDVAGAPERAKAVMGVVPQETAIYEDLSARENVAFWGKLYGLGGTELRRRVETTLDQVGLSPADKRSAKTFSGGMKRRLNLAMGLVHGPRLLLLDEPTVGIDPQARLNILEVVRGVAVSGTTVLYTTHYLEEAEDLCRRIAILDHGKLLAEGTAEELRALVGEGTIVTLRGGFSAEALRAQIAGVQEAQVLSIEERTAVLSVPGEKGTVARVLGELVRRGVDMEEVSIREPTLQNVFIKLTGRELRD